MPSNRLLGIPDSGTAPIDAVHGEGVYVYDAQGRDYIDCASGTFNLSLGYAHPEIVAVLRDHAGGLIHGTSSFGIEAVETLRRRLAELAPAGLTNVHLKVSGGSTANEGAIKMAQLTTGGRDVVTLFRSHHGQTALTTAISGNSFRRADFPAIGVPCVHVPDPYCFRCFYRQRRETCGLLCVERINDFIEQASTGDVACILVEPISGNGGNIVAPPGYLTALRRLCDERGILLIFDEVQTGIGRTGRMFAADYFGVTPDIMTVGKGLGGSGAPIAAIISSTRVLQLETYQHSFTFGGNVLSAIAAAKTLEVITRPGFLEHVRVVGAHIVKRLEDLAARHGVIGDVRGVGLMLGMEIVDETGRADVELTNDLAGHAPAVGLLLRTSQYTRGNVVKVRPPLIITIDEADMMCDRLDALFRAVTG